MRLKNWPAVGLIALALVTCLLVVLAFRHVRPTEVTPITQPTTDVAAGTPSSPSGQPAGTAEPTRTASAGAAAGGLPAVQSAFSGSDPIRVLVLGDESGDGADEWVALWAKELAADHTTKYSGWDSASRSFTRATSSGSGNGSEVSIFNASQESGTLTKTTQDLDAVRRAMSASGAATPAAKKVTDVVVVSFGYREQTEEFAQNLETLTEELEPGTPVLVVNQAPQKGSGANGQRDRARAATDWADQNKYGAVDVFAAFIAAPEPLAQLVDAKGVLPNARGHQVWAEAVAAKLQSS